MDEKLALWIENKKHLPKGLRTIEEQEYFFKLLEEKVEVVPNYISKLLDREQAREFVCEVLLPTLARYGWTLQIVKNKREESEYQAWRKKDRHLPSFLKDFHDQKDFFKFLTETVELPEHTTLKGMNFVDYNIYTIDSFLWPMARSLMIKKSRSDQNFDSIEDAIRQSNDVRIKNTMRVLLGNK